MFIQAGFAVDPPTARHLVWGTGHKKADLTDQLVWWWVHKLAVITMSIGSHLLHLSEEHIPIFLKLLDTFYFCHNPKQFSI